MNTYKSSEFKKIQTPFPYGEREKQYYKHKEKKFTLVFLDITTEYGKHIGIPSHHVAHICSQDGEPYHNDINISDQENMSFYQN